MQQKRKWITVAAGLTYVLAAMGIMLCTVMQREAGNGSRTESRSGWKTESKPESEAEGDSVTNEHSGEEKFAGNLAKKDETAYERVIFIDYSSGSGTEENEITLDILKRTEEKLAAQGAVKVYYINAENDERMPSVEEKLQEISETEADLYIEIELNENVDTSVYGIEVVYNGTYFIPDFGNAELADCLARNVTKQVSGRANGLTQATEEDIILQKVKVPAVVLKAGYLSNEKESGLLNTEAYRDRIAEGIAVTVQEAYEKMEKESE